MYISIVLLILFFLRNDSQKQDREYLVEVNQMMYAVETVLDSGTLDIGKIQNGEDLLQDLPLDSAPLYITKIRFLSEQAAKDSQKLQAFFKSQNGVETNIQPLFYAKEPIGFLRFDYKNKSGNERGIILTGVCFSIAGCGLFVLLLYIRNQIIKPFVMLSNIPYELSKGRLKGEIHESKNKFFGKFMWGIAMLGDTLSAAKTKELKLEKEKKMLLLALSHDIKTPLNTIKLYAKALEEGIYEEESKRKEVAHMIQVHTNEIDSFVKEIVKNSSEDIVSIEVKNSEFYIRDFVEKIEEYYRPKCKLKLIDFVIRPYENKLIKGDLDKSFEVIENIMENAFKYGDGDSITISFLEEEYCQLIRITNTGTPVSTEEIPHLFDSFYRGSNVGKQEGNGLGLYICREIMKKMEGDIFVEPGENQMSFTLVFRE